MGEPWTSSLVVGAATASLCPRETLFHVKAVPLAVSLLAGLRLEYRREERGKARPPCFNQLIRPGGRTLAAPHAGRRREHVQHGVKYYLDRGGGKGVGG